MESQTNESVEIHNTRKSFLSLAPIKSLKHTFWSKGVPFASPKMTILAYLELISILSLYSIKPN